MDTDNRSRNTAAFICNILLAVAILVMIDASRIEASTGVSATDTAKELARIESKVPESFVLVESAPFVVIGNLSENEMNRYIKGTIQNASTAFNKQFFDKKPDDVIKIYLFKDNESYLYYAKKLFNDDPSTPYGYFTPGRNRLVMNIGTGGGTLVHELFHSLVRYDFPNIPDWVNEGMASLYEQCGITNNRIKGEINWRFPILMKHLKNGDCIGLDDLMAKKKNEFYTKDNGSNYAVARYFCMYMQEKGMLEKFYREFRDNAENDPTGKKTLERLFGKPVPRIQKEWLQWVRQLAAGRSD
jgi:hypothetical protein